MKNLSDKIDVDTSNSISIKEIKTLIDLTVLSDLKWYMSATTRNLIAHWTFGTLIIALSVSLPLITAADYFGDPGMQKKVISIIGILIALITGLRSFFRWGEVYLANMKGMVELKNQVARWRLSIISAESCADPKKGIALAVAATKDLLMARDVIDKQNTEDYLQFFNPNEKKAS